MNQLGDALEAAGYTPEEVTKLRSDISRLREFKSVLVGFAQIVVVKHVIDCDADPFVPNGWGVEEHIKGGQFEWDPARVTLYLSEGQQNGKWIRGRGHDLREELKGKAAYNANLLDYFLAHRELIPEECKNQMTFFWGTIYSRDGGLRVRYLYWFGARWGWGFRRLDGGFCSRSPAAVPASI
ncbi:MAG: hypothetical protein O3C23_02890, partial [bacterium]|nr:hypothetical protein [bacterium]